MRFISVLAAILMLPVLSGCDDDGTPAADVCPCDSALADRGPDLAQGDLPTGVDSVPVDSAPHDSAIASGWVGTACTSDTTCQANDASAVCLSGGEWVWTGGYCSVSCDPTAQPDTCPTGSHCEELAQTGTNLTTCIKDCLTKNDCRPGYVCAPIPQTNIGGCVVL